VIKTFLEKYMLKKRYLILIVLIAIAAVLNILVLGILSRQDNGKPPSVANPTHKVLVSTIPSNSSPIQEGTTLSPSSSNSSLDITNIQTNRSAGSFLVSVFNNGSTETAIANICINDYTIIPETSIAIPAYSSIKVLLTLTEGIRFGGTYQIRLQSSEGYSAPVYEIID